MAILGLYKIITNHRILIQDQTLKIFALVFLCLWLPLLISLPDAVNPAHSSHTIFPYLRFFFAGIFIIEEISKDKDRLRLIIFGIFFIVFFWCIDATIQFIFNQNILGFPYVPGHITGMFYPRNTISHICSILSSFYFLYIYINIEKKKWLFLSLAPMFFIILLSGRRAAWVMLALTSLSFLIYGYRYAKNRKQFKQVSSVLVILITIVLSSTIIFHAPTNERFKITLGLFSTNYETINDATATRLPIWETAYSIFKSNPINGIGPRGFRHVYKDYASPNDIWVKINIPPTQPHIVILEILAETGLIGLIGYMLLFYLISQVALQSKERESLLPFFIPVIVALFPFNTHMAFYGSIWSSMIWLLLALYFTKAKLIT
jgi:O-antigen ligase